MSNRYKLKYDLVSLIVSVVLTVFVLVIKGFFVQSIFINLLLLILTVPVQFICGWKFIKGGWQSIVNKSPNMNLLVALGTLITFFYSIYAMFAGGVTYFETSCMLISFISFGKYVENKAKNKTNEAIDGLVNLVPDTMHRLVGINSDEELIENFEAGKNFALETVSSSEVKKNDYIFIGEGESIPADAVVILGETKIDESMLTGESDLVLRTYNEDITGGTILVSGQAIVRVSHSYEESVLSKIVNAVTEAQSSKAPVARIADKVAGVFVPVILGIALLTFIGWMVFYDGLFFIKFNHALMCAVSVLTISCPCALVLATPITLTVGMGKAAQLGIIIRDASVLENMCKIKHMVFDKTGTLTQSNLDKNEMAAKTLRTDAKETVFKLKDELSIESYMISGDRQDEAFRVAGQLGIKYENVVSQATPLSKKDYLLKFMNNALDNNKDDGLFGYVGDGINDAPAMTTADVGITLESATDIALETGDVVLMHNKLIDLIPAIRLSKASMRKIKQNLFWALIYNVVFIPLAIFGIMAPMWCGAAHAISSLIVVFNALLLKRFK